MKLESVRVDQLRCLQQVRFDPAPKHNLFWGDNGSGKTSLLEAIYLLGRGHSFRHSGHRRLIRDGEPHCTVWAKVRDEKNHTIPIAIQKSSEGTRLKVGQDKQVRLSELARYCPVLVLEPGQHRLLEDGPVLRRRYLDWSVFHVEQDYLLAWQKFSMALRQRNALLRQKQTSQLASWDEQFSSAANTVHEHRRAVFDEMRPHIESLLRCFFEDQPGISVEYRRGWNKASELSELLREQVKVDLERGFTQSGPQRAELRILVDGHLAKDTLSRGQQKILITALLLGQAQHFRERVGASPILLVDDLSSELGSTARERLFSWLSEYPGQCFVTTLDLSHVPDILRKSARMFHVKHGQVQLQA